MVKYVSFVRAVGFWTSVACLPGFGAEPEALIERFGADRSDIERFYSIPESETRTNRLLKRIEDYLEQTRAIDFEALDRAGRIDLILMENHLRHEREWLLLERARHEEILPLIPFAGDIVHLEERRWRVEPVQPEDAAKRMAGVADAIERLRKRLMPKAAKGADVRSASEPADATMSIDPLHALRAARAVDSLRRTLNHWFGQYDGYHPGFSWWCAAPHGEADGALRGYADFLRGDIAGIEGEEDDPLIGEPAGRDELLAGLRAEMIPYGPGELIAIGEREFAWCEARMEEAAAELGFGDWREALDHVKELHAAPGEQDGVMARLAREAEEYVIRNHLVDVPDLCRELWRVEMIPEETQKILPYAAYGGLHMMVAFPVLGMDDAQKRMSMRGNNIHFSRIVAAHELIPGHHLQRFAANRSNTHRSLFNTPFFVEGWALHWEMLLWDRGYARGPEDRIGMLFWRMLRCARIFVSLKYHLGEMTPDEMVKFMMERVGLEKRSATGEVRRYIGGLYSPLYQCAYLIGGLQLRALHRELTESGAMTDFEFHNRVLEQNAIPIAMVRAALTEMELKRDSGPDWRFAD